MKVLVAYDGSVPAQKALEHAVEQYGDSELVLLRVIEIAGGATGAGINLAQESLRKRRNEATEKLSAEVTDLVSVDDLDLSMETAVGQPAREIVDFAEEHDVDHIVIGNHGRAGVSRVLLGSVAERVVRRAHIPVTVVR